MTNNHPVALALGYLNGEIPPGAELVELPIQLARNPTFGLGLRVFDKLKLETDPATRQSFEDKLEKIAQKAALCAYKNPDVPAQEGLARAQQILEVDCRLEQSDDAETLGIAGAVFKRKWDRSGRTIDLGRSLRYYRLSFSGQPRKAGAAQAEKIQRTRIGRDQGYTAINAAFMADTFAENLRTADDLDGAERQGREADRIRKLILEVLDEPARPDSGMTEDDAQSYYWSAVTQVEAAFGLGRFDDAERLLALPLALPLFTRDELKKSYTWMRQSTATQLAKIVRMRFAGDQRPRRVLQTLLGDDVSLEAVDSLILGKVGMAMSGGGFRSSFFHIGVLARLAELDVLRFVEVLSTVSGGSILGAHYYLLLKRLLEDKGELRRADYIKVVEDMANDFLAAVQTDVRSTLYRDLPVRLSELLRPGIVVGQALGRKFEEHFYGPALAEPREEGRIYLDQLSIAPAGDSGFQPGHDNWRRHSKVPVLVLNATSLNTGHVWQFTTTYAGESPYAIDSTVDSNDRLRRFSYRSKASDGKERLIDERRVPLGTAVAASACVPGLFPPIDLGGLYPEHQVRLVDGGVHDNQGIISLLEQDCTQLIVSDACGQMTTETAPWGVAAGPVLRSNSILMERVRQEEHERVDALRDSSRLSGFLFVHLRQELSGDAIDWQGCESPVDRGERDPILSYGIRRDYQEALAAMRTDLDAFSEVEAYALMYSGYRMADKGFAAAVPDLARLASNESPYDGWKFLGVETLMTDREPTDPRHGRFAEVLREGAKQFFRDTEEEEERVMKYLSGVASQAKLVAGIAAALLLLIPALVWILVGQLQALWAGLGLLASVLVGLGTFAVNAFRELTKAKEEAQLPSWGEAGPVIAYAGVLWAAKRFSTFHLQHYKDKLLEQATVASLR